MTERSAVRACDLVGAVFLGVLLNQLFFPFITTAPGKCHQTQPLSDLQLPAVPRWQQEKCCPTGSRAFTPLFWADVSLACLDNAVIVTIFFKEVFCLG